MRENGNKELLDLLFGDGTELLNIKFFPSTTPGLTADRLAAAAQKVIASARLNGPIHNPPVSGREKSKLVDL